MARHFTILVVDDDVRVREAIRTILCHDHHDVVTASNGVEALAEAMHEGPDLVLLDLTMPGMDGHEVIKLLRCCDVTFDVPIIALAERGDEDAELTFKEGADDLLTKPFAPAHLRARVKTWLLRGGHSNQRAAA